MPKRIVAVIGGGNGSFAAVADAVEGGHDVRWWRRNRESFGPICSRRAIAATDHAGTREVAVEPTDDLAAAVSDADLVLAPIPATGQIELAEALAPHLRDGQVIYLPPGTFGSYLMLRRMREMGMTADVAIAETGTLPWLCRKTAPDAVRITTRASRLPTGTIPARMSGAALSVISDVFPGAIEPVEDALSAALMNAGPIIHPPLILMNAGPIEHFDRWDIHNEGTQPAIRAVHDALDAERIAVREALGYAPPHFPLRDHYETSDWMYGNLAHDKLVDSGDWHEALDLHHHRYMSEDIALGLVFLVSVAEWADVPVPVAKGLVALASAVTGRDLLSEGRTLDSMALSGLSRDAMTSLLQDGSIPHRG